MTDIIVIGVEHHNTLGMVRCLGMAGHRVYLLIVGERKGFVCKSRYVKQSLLIKDVKSIPDILMGKFRDENCCPIVISCTDSIASVLDRNYAQLRNDFIFFNAGEAGRITHYMDKQVQVELAKDIGLNVPSSIVFRKDMEQQIKFPCILKPARSINGGKHIVLCSNMTDFKKSIGSFSADNIVQVQQFIKKEAEIVLLGLSIDGRIVIPGYILKHRENNGGTLYSSVRPIVELRNDFIIKCKEFILRTKYEGLFGMEFIKSDNDFYFIETNFRNDATTYSIAKAGFNLPEMYVRTVRHEKIDATSFRVNKIQSIVEFNDFKHRNEYGVSLYLWLVQYLKAKCKYYFDLHDLLPFFYAPFKLRH